MKCKMFLTITPNSPLEQFSILPLIPMNIGNFYFSFTNPSLFMLLNLSLVLLLVHFVTKKGGGNSVPNAWQSLVELIHDFVSNPVNEQIGGLSGNVKQKFSPRISVTFTFLLFRNPQGMIPYSFTVTSHFLITLGLSNIQGIGGSILPMSSHGPVPSALFLCVGVLWISIVSMDSSPGSGRVSSSSSSNPNNNNNNKRKRKRDEEMGLIYDLVVREVSRYLEKYSEELKSEFPGAVAYVDTPVFFNKLAREVLEDGAPANSNLQLLKATHKVFSEDLPHIDTYSNNTIYSKLVILLKDYR